MIPKCLITLALFSFSVNANSQQNPSPFDYGKSWKEVEKYDQKNLPASASKVVDKIYAAAKSEGNQVQLMKSILAQTGYIQTLNEDPFPKVVAKLQAEIHLAGTPNRQILYAFLGRQYWDYYQSNRYRFRNRTTTVNYLEKDVSTWSLEQLVDKTIECYMLSLKAEDKLKKTPVSAYDALEIGGNKLGRAYRPTLYDLLAHNALDLFSSSEPDITKPAYSFSLNKSDYFSNSQDFVKLTIPNKDSLSYKYYALRLYQGLINFHLGDAQPDALIDAERSRLRFVNQQSTLTGHTDFYRKALEALDEKYKKYPVSSFILLDLATNWETGSNHYNPLQSEDHHWDKKKAYDLCEQAIHRFPESDGAKAAYNFQQSLLVKDLEAITEKVNVPETPFRVKVTFQNVKSLYWRIIPYFSKEVDAQRKIWEKNTDIGEDELFIRYFSAKQAVASGHVLLPDELDYQKHSAEIKLDGVPAGNYLILLSNLPTFDLKNNGMAYAVTTISNLAYIHRNQKDGTTDFYVLKRTTGEAVPEASMQVYVSYYDSKKGSYQRRLTDRLTTDQEGYVKVPYQFKPEKGNLNSYEVVITSGGDTISTIDDDNYYRYGKFNQLQSNERPEFERTVFFLDRAIYRPGQTLYFKGLLYKTDGKTPGIVKNRTLTIIMRDVNWQEVAQQQVTTNEYGTFSGTFTTPASGLMGRMSLAVNDGAGSLVSFSVEAYKRPKFEVKFDPLKGSFKLGDKVKVAGKGLAYSGASIDGAQVSFRVVRKTSFPYWWWCWHGYYPPSGETEITHGKLQTKADGSFDIEFDALADESVDKSSSPTFDFEISADVTDINGETHSATTHVELGYKGLKLEVNAHDLEVSSMPMPADSFTIRAMNRSGEPEPVTADIKVWQLKAPGKVYRERMWERPDTFAMSKEEFEKYFPFDPYKDESNFYLWDKGKQMIAEQFNTGQKTSWLPVFHDWEPGKYILQVTATGKDGEEVKEVAYFEVNDPSVLSPAITKPLIVAECKQPVEPGDTAIIRVVAPGPVHYRYELEQDGQLLQSLGGKIQREQKSITIPILESYRGNVAVHLVAVWNNRLYNQIRMIQVPYTNKELDIRFESFRDKLQPGQEEQWKIRISSRKAEKMMAEMVATLYDASLDAFTRHGWEADFYSSLQAQLGWQSQNGFESQDFTNNNYWTEGQYKNYEQPEYPGWNISYGSGSGVYRMEEMNYMVVGYADKPRAKMSKMAFAAPVVGDTAMDEKKEVIEREVSPIPNMEGRNKSKSGGAQIDLGEVKIRKNFNETAFFFPHLMTNEQGEITINFTIPEALTKWKMLGFAHTQDLKYGLISRELVTQKDLMVVPNQPRFFREGDQMLFQTKISNLVDHNLEGIAQLHFFDALTMQSVDSLVLVQEPQQSFNLKARQSENIQWKIKIPEGLQAVTYRVVARAGDFSDGEEMTLPVVTNRTLVTETLPLPVRGAGIKNFTLDKMVQNTSTTLRNQRLTLEYTSNPAWYAIQALPYMMEYPYECTEQLFSRFYANSIASHVASSNPVIKQVFDTWARIQPDALLSKLEKNEELKTALLTETPWVLNAKDESQRKRNLALLFDLNKMASEKETALEKMKKAQLENGSFSWFPGMPEDRYMTQYIVSGMGHLKVMGIQTVQEETVNNMLIQALAYMDKKMNADYLELKKLAKKGKIKLTDNHLDGLNIQYLYARTYFTDSPVKDNYREAFNYWIGQSKKYWVNRDIYTQGLIALALSRSGEKTVPAEIVRSLKERSFHSEEMGMYWKTEGGYYWYQAPIETQALMTEVFDDVAHDPQAVEDLKVWLLKQKQTQDWKTTRATAEACYALLRRGTDILANSEPVEITLGGTKLDPAQREDTRVEAGTGYFKTAWTAALIKPEMGKIEVKKNGEGVAWGAIYWQYFEQLDKITTAETPLKISKQLFLQTNTDRGPVIIPVKDSTRLHVGDLLKVRIGIRSDRAMEYVHLKDMRASALEPTETLSGYKYQDGLWYYQSQGDLAANFFIGYLPKGTYVFEYDLRVSQSGDFSNGITTMQCMYAPEFSSHSEGVRIKVD